MRKVVQEIGKRQKSSGKEAVKVGLVKVHVGIFGKEEVDKQEQPGNRTRPR